MIKINNHKLIFSSKLYILGLFDIDVKNNLSSFVNSSSSLFSKAMYLLFTTFNLSSLVTDF